MSEAGYRRVLVGLGCGILLCVLTIVWNVMWWSSAWGAFVEEVQAGRVGSGQGVWEAAHGYIGRRPEYVLFWAVLGAAMGIAGVLIGLRRGKW